MPERCKKGDPAQNGAPQWQGLCLNTIKESIRHKTELLSARSVPGSGMKDNLAQNGAHKGHDLCQPTAKRVIWHKGSAAAT